MGPSRSCWDSTSALQPEGITSKGTSFMYVLSIKVPIRKVWKHLVILVYVHNVEMIDCSESDSMIEIYGNLDKLNT